MTLTFCNNCNRKTEWDDTPVCVECGVFASIKADNETFTEAIEYIDTEQIGTHTSGPEKVQVRSRNGHGSNRGPTVETHWNAFENGKRAVLALATALNIPFSIISSAYNTYHLGLDIKFTRGRGVERVAAACLYIACRLNGHPVMLMDFIEHLSVPTSPIVLSRTCIRLSRALSIVLPPILGGTSSSSNALDPSSFLYRFASKLELGDKNNIRKVALTAVRILKRMQEDWIHWGRHPAGLFGASLLIAARLHGFNRTRTEISRVVYIGDGTVGRRVTDFSRTPSAQLSLNEFDQVGLPSCNPPAFEKGRLKWDNPNDIIRWPEALPERPKDVVKWIEQGMGTSSLSDKNKIKSNKTHKTHKNLNKIIKSQKTDRFIVDTDSEDNLESLDPEIDSYILESRDYERNIKIWDSVNQEWIVEQKEKDERLRLEEERALLLKSKKEGEIFSEESKIIPKKRKRKKTVSEAFKLVLEEEKLDRKSKNLKILDSFIKNTSENHILDSKIVKKQDKKEDFKCLEENSTLIKSGTSVKDDNFSLPDLNDADLDLDYSEIDSSLSTKKYNETKDKNNIIKSNSVKENDSELLNDKILSEISFSSENDEFLGGESDQENGEKMAGVSLLAKKMNIISADEESVFTDEY